jgi:hypothetical protein
VTHSWAAAGALRNLAVNPKLRDQIADEGAITPLVDLLKLPNLRVVKHAGSHFTFLNVLNLLALLVQTYKAWTS